jgi:branched-subunit amino acid transport protein
MTLFKKLVAGIGLALTVTALAAPLAHATGAHHTLDAGVDAVAPVAQEGASLVLSQPVMAAITIVLLPVLIGLSRKESLKGKWKFAIAAIVTIATTIIERSIKLPDGSAMVSGKMAYDVLLMFVGSQVALNGWDQFGSGARLAPKLGIG